MRIYIMTDMEAASGSLWGGYGLPQSGEGDRSLRYMSGEINAAIAGAKAGGAEEVHVFEVGHHPFVADVISETYTRSTDMFAVRDMDGLMFVGQHGPAGVRDGVLSHCSCGKTVMSLRVNGHNVGEMGLFAGYAGHFDVPTLMVAGDRSVARETEDLIGDTEIACVTEGLGNNTAICLAPKAAQRLVYEKAKAGVRRASAIAPMTMTPPLNVEYRVTYCVIADSLERLPGVRRKDERTVEYTCENWLELHEMFHITVMAQQFWDSRIASC